MRTRDLIGHGLVGYAITLCIVMALGPGFSHATKPDPSAGSGALASLGQIGPEAIDLKVWTEKPKSVKADSGTPAVIRVNVSKKAYLTVVYLSSNGDAIVLLPNRDTPDSLIQPGQDYTLFGPESPVRLKETDKAKDAKLVLYLSSVPFKQDPLSVPSGEPFLKIPQSAVQERGILIEKIDALAKAPGFNRKVVALKNGAQKNAPLDLMGLPTDVKTAKPVGVTGVQGLKTKILESTKE